MSRKLQNQELNRLTVEKFKIVSKTPLILILDNVRSMHNVGSIFRTADAFRVSKIYLCGITATPPHRDIRKTALGADESVEWEYVEDAALLIPELKDYTLCALEQAENSVSLRDFSHNSSPIALIVGNEVEGVQQKLLDLCNNIIEIPQFGTKHSFNVSVSAGIAMWEIYNKLNNQ
ncbi:RNA methyltransferase [bacterium]|nr:RNA methyltransferase [bacterium]